MTLCESRKRWRQAKILPMAEASEIRQELQKTLEEESNQKDISKRRRKMTDIEHWEKWIWLFNPRTILYRNFGNGWEIYICHSHWGPTHSSSWSNIVPIQQNYIIHFLVSTCHHWWWTNLLETRTTSWPIWKPTTYCTSFQL